MKGGFRRMATGSVRLSDAHGSDCGRCVRLAIGRDDGGGGMRGRLAEACGARAWGSN
ncbi:hypothetical protein ERO13_D09G159200v2 [Gossypium hirsutum]|uniref:Uncharacterized protein n=4 Tax=Gossypium TaxID=3633 RepID=A0A5J5Q3Z8_GOSBA|nr:hypothetical protein ES319_D09G178100v1 [Gossypium barbadense]KAG4130671.1 hypothetical protein ERO13_D09G159200v2 [Gossypium hirsutum]TYG54496.1 hypothetical protein ES288_D09G194900v1 [Gossypium darwinii]TYH54740.1 hypothetical protein ES332_D09G191000v1 [Gossypium tomentosum]TYI65831.1 hypothetical protein E1A91_D09G184100v1 [Gossypium mustelinum]